MTDWLGNETKEYEVRFEIAGYVEATSLEEAKDKFREELNALSGVTVMDSYVQESDRINEEDKTFEFGVMSKKWRMKAKDRNYARTAICIFIGKDVPIVAYGSKPESFLPSIMLNTLDELHLERKYLDEALLSIEEITGQ